MSNDKGTEQTAKEAVKRAVIYARVSTDEQTKGYSLQTQLDECRRYAASCGYSVLAEFSDDYTGASLDRPELDKLRKFVAGNPVEVMIVYDLDRLARKSVYQMLIEEELGKQGIKVEYVNGQYADTDEGRLQKQIKASIAEYEKAKILERSKRGKRGKAQSGFVIVGARPPYGYRVVSEPHKAWLEVDEDEAQVVRRVFQWYVYGDGQWEPISINAIAGRLTEMRVPTRGDKYKHVVKKNGRGIWTAGMVRHILTCETYTGTWHYGKTKMVSVEEARKIKSKRSPRKEKKDKSAAKIGPGEQVSRRRDEWIAVQVPAIVDAKIFGLAKRRRELNVEQARRNTRREYLMGRRLRCAKCGYTYQGATRHERNRYYCCNGRKQRPISVCDMPNFRVDLVDDAVWTWVKGIMQHPEQLAEGLKAQQAEAELANSALMDRLTMIDSRLAEIENQSAKLLDLYLGSDFPKDMLNERKMQLEKDAADLRRERAELSAHLRSVIMADEQIAEIEAFCVEVRDGLGHATFEDKRRYFDLLDVRGTLAVESGEKVVYVRCKLGEQRVSVAVISPSSSIGAIATTFCAFLPILPSR